MGDAFSIDQDLMLVINAFFVLYRDVLLSGLYVVDFNDVTNDVQDDKVLLIESKQIVLGTLIVCQVHDKQLHVANGALDRLQRLFLIFTTLFDHLARQHDDCLLGRLHLL